MLEQNEIESSIAKGKRILGITKKLTSEQWGKILEKNPEAFGIPKDHMSRIKTTIKKLTEEYDRLYNPDLNLREKNAGRPKVTNEDKVAEFINIHLTEKPMLIKILRSLIKEKFEVSDSKAESLYTKYCETNSEVIIRESIKGLGWVIKLKGFEGTKEISKENNKENENNVMGKWI